MQGLPHGTAKGTLLAFLALYLATTKAKSHHRITNVGLYEHIRLVAKMTSSEQHDEAGPGLAVSQAAVELISFTMAK